MAADGPEFQRTDSGSTNPSLDDYQSRFAVSKALLKGSPTQTAPSAGGPPVMSKLRSPSIVDISSPHASQQVLETLDRLLDDDQPNRTKANGTFAAASASASNNNNNGSSKTSNNNNNNNLSVTVTRAPGHGDDLTPSPSASPRVVARGISPADPAYFHQYTDEEDEADDARGNNRDGPPMYANFKSRLAATGGASVGAPGRRLNGAKTMTGALRTSNSQDIERTVQPRNKKALNSAYGKTSTAASLSAAMQNRGDAALRKHQDAKQRMVQRNRFSSDSLNGLMSPERGPPSGRGQNPQTGDMDDAYNFFSELQRSARSTTSQPPQNGSRDRSASPTGKIRGGQGQAMMGGGGRRAEDSDQQPPPRRKVQPDPRDDEDDDAAGGKITNTNDADNMVILQQRLEDTRREIEDESRKRLMLQAENDRLRAIEVEWAQLKEAAKHQTESSEAEKKRELELNMLRRQAQFNEQKMKDLKEELAGRQKEYDQYVEEHRHQIASHKQLQETLQQREYVIGELCQEIERIKREALDLKFREIDSQIQALSRRNTSLSTPSGETDGPAAIVLAASPRNSQNVDPRTRSEMLEAAKQEIVAKAMKEIQEHPDVYFSGGGCCGGRQKEGKKSSSFWSCGGR